MFSGDITGSLLSELIIDSVVIAEEQARGSAKWAYEFELRSKVEAADRIAQRRLAEIERRRLEAEQLSASRIEKVDEMKHSSSLIKRKRYDL